MRFRLIRSTSVLVAVVVLWAASLALPAIDVEGRVYNGLDLLVEGWRGYAYGVYAWVANPGLIVALVAAAFRLHLLAAALAALSVALGATSFLAGDLLSIQIGREIEVELRSGFYVWLLAPLVLCLHSLTEAVLVRRGRSRADAGTSRD